MQIQQDFQISNHVVMCFDISIGIHCFSCCALVEVVLRKVLILFSTLAPLDTAEFRVSLCHPSIAHRLKLLKALGERNEADQDDEDTHILAFTSS